MATNVTTSVKGAEIDPLDFDTHLGRRIKATAFDDEAIISIAFGFKATEPNTMDARINREEAVELISWLCRHFNIEVTMEEVLIRRATVKELPW